MDATGTVVYEISSSQRNGEGAFIDLPDGRLAYAYSHCIGSGFHDDSPSCIAIRYSQDAGHTWSDETIIATPEDHDALNVMSVSLLELEDGQVGLFYLIRYGWHDTRLHLRRSDDKGRTWGPTVRCVPAPGYFVTNNDRVVRLSTGRIIAPANYHRMRGEDTLAWSSWDPRSIGLFYLSDDDGKTWREAEESCALSAPKSRSGLQETGVVELLNGTVWAWFRTDLGYQYESFSRDMGETWTVPGPSRFRSPNSPLSIKRISGQDTLIALWNPIAARGISGSGLADRTPLVYALSRDDGATWTDPVVIEDDEEVGFSYVSIHTTENTVLLAYFIEKLDAGRLVGRVLRMRELPLAALG